MKTLTKEKKSLLKEGQAITREVEVLVNEYKRTKDEHFLDRALMVSEIFTELYKRLEGVHNDKKEIITDGFKIEIIDGGYKLTELANNDERYVGWLGMVAVWIGYKTYEWTEIDWINNNREKSEKEVIEYKNK